MDCTTLSIWLSESNLLSFWLTSATARMGGRAGGGGTSAPADQLTSTTSKHDQGCSVSTTGLASATSFRGEELSRAGMASANLQKGAQPARRPLGPQPPPRHAAGGQASHRSGMLRQVQPPCLVLPGDSRAQPGGSNRARPPGPGPPALATHR